MWVAIAVHYVVGTCNVPFSCSRWHLNHRRLSNHRRRRDVVFLFLLARKIELFGPKVGRDQAKGWSLIDWDQDMCCAASDTMLLLLAARIVLISSTYLATNPYYTLFSFSYHKYPSIFLFTIHEWHHFLGKEYGCKSLLCIPVFFFDSMHACKWTNI